MPGARVVSSFLVTLAVLALIVGFSLRRDNVQAQAPPAQTTTMVVYHPVATLSPLETSTVYVVNVGTDPDAPAEKFTIFFEDVQGNQVQAPSTCEVSAGETCSATYACIAGNGKKGKGACVIRATVVGEEMGCVAAGMGTGQWTTNLEILSPKRESKLILGAHGAVLQLPTETCVPGVDSGVDSIGTDIGGSPDTPAPSVDSFVPSIDSVPPPSLDSVPSLDSPAPPVVPSGQH